MGQVSARVDPSGDRVGGGRPQQSPGRAGGAGPGAVARGLNCEGARQNSIRSSTSQIDVAEPLGKLERRQIEPVLRAPDRELLAHLLGAAPSDLAADAPGHAALLHRRADGKLKH